jgi:glucose/arabinose dehydrogenase
MSVLTPVSTMLLTLGLLASVPAAGAPSPPSSTTAAHSARGAAAPAATARAVPAGFTQRTVVRRLTRATDMAFAPDGRLFITLKGGVLRYRRTNGGMATLLNFSRKINDAGERGLLGVAVDPRFARNHHLFLVYTHRATRRQPLHNRLVRVTVRRGQLAPGSERLLFRFPGLSATNHNGGSVHVGPDGMLYVSHGENARPDQAQSLRSLLGKIVRLNRNGTIPASNPFFNRANGRNRAIWVRGLRNPFKFTFDQRTGRGYINDVGAQTWEEIDRMAKGRNYGWPIQEGPESSPQFTPPVFAYRHGSTATTGCSITGGEFYRAARRNFPTRFVGDYFFTDLCGGWVRRYDPRTDRTTSFASGFGAPVDLEVDRRGSLFVLLHGTPGRLVRIRFNG